MTTSADMPSTELRVQFSSLSEWKQFVATNPVYLDHGFIRQTAERIRSEGFHFDFLGKEISPDQMLFVGDNYRETISFLGINTRMRAVLDELMYHVGDSPIDRYRIYSPEALSNFALLLKNKFTHFIGSEFAKDTETRQKLYPIQHQDLLNLSLESLYFDAVVINEVFEHLPDIRHALSEIARITKPGGRLISTFPFSAFSKQGHVKAKWSDSGIEYLEPAEYHDDPLNPAGALVFEVPGWDILRHCASAGFSQARMVYVLSRRRGIIAPHYGGVFVLVASK